MYDVAILGGGPGGYVAAIRAAQLGLSVVVVEKDELGGTCLNRGCIPTKALVSTAERLHQIKNSAAFGIEVTGYNFNFQKAAERKNQVVERLVKGIHYLFKKSKITLIKGTGKLTGKNEITVETSDGLEKVEAKNIILATGSKPALISALGYDGERVITSDEALNLEKLPAEMVIIGGGVIGSEFATIFSEMGVKVTIVELLPSILANTDKEVSRYLTTLFKKRGIQVKTKVAVKEVKKGEKVTVVLENGEELVTDMVLISIGRVLNTKDIGLEEVGVALGPKGEVLVDEYLRTNVENIYAIGDITSKMQLAHVASAQGIRVVENLVGEPQPMSYDVVPGCIFTLPEIAMVGLTSQEAEEKGIKIITGKFPFQASGKAVAMEETEGFVKIIADFYTHRILGGHIVGPHATDLIGEIALAVQKGLTLEEVAHTIHAHPSLPEAVMEAAEAALNRAIHI
ncbi:dihydrolipoyl dehydrogenase [Carboxydothermus hydrogenoformans]|uniref:Dihydrolipoyl dehydrogenase n=1 Tax=Carboxydothermus hydrogenoformans (strain ATCC BAA-161 / DSM 6008 / Z-2901) TaxID=246194 RepID=Q3AE67_CARHZ|nr:dihydrolipoyl dehydrogenase [Carboxydothermus hydrogenoformans]ABB15243.1 alpha keto acid dehydrogenase complex, E3 component, lipoamide dehydrogenase [Carboxydothermus hydrogenoformans Z-2901]